MRFKISSIISILLLIFFILNIIIFFDFQNQIIRSFFSILFLLLIPGILMLLILKIKNTNFWEYIIYAIALSISLLLISSLFINWLYPVLGITNKPLSLNYLIISMDLLLALLLISAYVKNKNAVCEIKIPVLNLVNVLFISFATIFPILSIMGANIINNGGSNMITLVMLVGIALYVSLVALFHNQLNKNIFPYSILMISISILFMGWLRSWYVSGADINLEYHIFQLIKKEQIWNMLIFNTPYNACLSVSILPTVLSMFININDHYIFKIIIPLIFSLTPVSVYLIAKRYASEIIAYMASIFFLSQSSFITWWQIPIRQEIALFLYSCIILLLFNKRIPSGKKHILFNFFIIVLILSHYSSTYIAVGLFIFVYILFFLYRYLANSLLFQALVYKTLRKSVKTDNTQPSISIWMIVCSILFTIIWYVQVTNISSGVVNFTKKSVGNINQVFNNNIRSEGSSLAAQWNIFYKPSINSNILEEYQLIMKERNKKTNDVNMYPENVSANLKTHIIKPEIIPIQVDEVIAKIVYAFMGIITKLFKIFIVIGIIYILISRKVKNVLDKEYIILILGSFLATVLALIMPYASIDYDVMRLYQQSLIILSLTAVLGVGLFFKKIKNVNVKFFCISMFFILFFMFQSGFIPQIIGGMPATLQLNNYGNSYYEFYVHKTEIASANWLYNYDSNEIIHIDSRAINRLLLASRANNEKNFVFNRNLFPSLIDKKAYVYSGYANTILNKAIISINGNTILYNFPKDFIFNYKNLIYSNKTSNIYK